MAGECHSAVLRWLTVFRGFGERSGRWSYAPGGTRPRLWQRFAADEQAQHPRMVQHIRVCEYPPDWAARERAVGKFRAQYSSGPRDEEHRFLRLQELSGCRI